jgi:hypothetical protein
VIGPQAHRQDTASVGVPIDGDPVAIDTAIGADQLKVRMNGNASHSNTPHALRLRQPTARGPAFATGSCGQLHDENFVIHSVVHHLPRARLIWRQVGEIGEIEASDFPHPARGRTYLRIEPHEPERLATDAAKSLLHRHKTLSI